MSSVCNRSETRFYYRRNVPMWHAHIQYHIKKKKK